MTTVSAVPANDSVDIFQRDLERIKVQLKNKKLTVNQASVLLLALQARQNNILIAQNSEIISRLKHESK